jgi:NitT/TauT family transport system substrate-binding protein
VWLRGGAPIGQSAPPRTGVASQEQVCGGQAAKGYTPNPDYARQALRELPYRRWRDYSPEDTLRFYALRLREGGMVKSAPEKIITQGTDWRIVEQLKREMKA